MYYLDDDIDLPVGRVLPVDPPAAPPATVDTPTVGPPPGLYELDDPANLVDAVDYTAEEEASHQLHGWSS